MFNRTDRDSANTKEEKTVKKNHVFMISISVLVVIGIVIGIVLVNSHKNDNIPTNPPATTVTEPTKEVTTPAPVTTEPTITPAPVTTKPVETAKPIETTKPVETSKPSDKPETNESCIVLDSEYTKNLKYYSSIKDPSQKMIGAKVPIDTKVYAPFDGYVRTAFSDKSNAALVIVFRNEKQKINDGVGLGIGSGKWSNLVSSGTLVKKGDYIGTISSTTGYYEGKLTENGVNFLIAPTIMSWLKTTDTTTALADLKDYIQKAEQTPVQKPER